MGQKMVIRFWRESRLSSGSRNHLITFCRPFFHYACFKIVLHDSSLYPKQLFISSDRIGCITNFCSMIKQLHELKNSTC